MLDTGRGPKMCLMQVKVMDLEKFFICWASKYSGELSQLETSRA